MSHWLGGSCERNVFYKRRVSIHMEEKASQVLMVFGSLMVEKTFLLSFLKEPRVTTRVAVCGCTCWEGLKAGEGDNRGWDGWMTSLTQWTWVWVISGSRWWTGRPGVLQPMGSQRVGDNWATELSMECVWGSRYRMTSGWTSAHKIVGPSM